MINIYLIIFFFINVSAVITPLYKTSDFFYADTASSFLTSDSEYFTGTFPTGFHISTANYRSPFFAIKKM